MNFLWAFLIIISYIFALCTGNMDKINNSIYSSINDLVKIVVTIIGNMCFWSGIINIIKNTNLINILKKAIKPIINILFPNEKDNKKAVDYISINIISNLLGIGNAATPAGLSAIKEMQLENKEKNKLTDSMAMLIVLNTTSIQLIPTTVIAIRSSLNSKNPAQIIFYIWISTISGTLMGIISTKLLLKIQKNKFGR